MSDDRETVTIQLVASRLVWGYVVEAIHAYLNEEGGSMNSEIGQELDGLSRRIERSVGLAWCTECESFVAVPEHDPTHVLG